MNRTNYLTSFAILTISCAKLAFAEPLTLEQAEAQLLLRNRYILSAVSAFEGAKAGFTIAGQAPNPALNYSGVTFSPRAGLGAGPWKDKRLDQTIGLSQLIERGGKRQLRGDVARAQLESVSALVADTRRTQRVALHEAYFGLKAATERARISRETADLFARAEDVGRKRLKAGDVAPVDVSRLRVEALRAENDAQTTATELVRARQNLAILLGTEAKASSLDPVDAWPDMADGALADGDMARRPDVRAAQARLAAADKARELERSLATRDVTVGVQAERYPPEAGVTWGVSLGIPLFWRYGYEGEAARAEADYTQARVEGDRVLALASSEAVSARAALEAARARIKRLEASVLPEARRVAAAAELAYSRGASGLTDLLDARRTLRATELDAVSARADFAAARAQWLAATQWESMEPQAEP